MDFSAMHTVRLKLKQILNLRMLKLIPYLLAVETTIFVGSVVGLFFLSQANFLLFHCIAELFSIVVGYAAALIVFHTRHISSNGFLVCVGMSYLFVSTMDMGHTLGYQVCGQT
jgi:hypothetical protein